MVKADDSVIFDINHPENFTEFEYLKAKVEHLENIVNSHADVMADNGLTLTQEHTVRYVDEEEVFKALSGE